MAIKMRSSVRTIAQPSVKLATSEDEPYLIDAFERALSPYYGGDHLVHAERVLHTHLSGGADDRGLLSARQLLLVLWEGSQRRGILNLVFKRQSTCKISPLILFPSNQDHRGLGTILLHAAENEARKAGARHIYCTVARSNQNTLTFFLQLGFVRCGDAHEQYKPGETEILLRKPLFNTAAPDMEDVISVSQIQDDLAWSQLKGLLSSNLTSLVDGVSDTWLESMRRNTREYDNSSKDEGRRARVYAARDRSGRYRAGAIVTYKKGGALKVMPIASRDIQAFRALIFDLPTLLFGCGRKAYLHHIPSAAEVAALQESPWRLEALLPGAYKENEVTQQWGCSLGKDAPIRSLRIQDRYLAMIKEGEKTLEIRVAYDHIKRIKPGDQIKLIGNCDQAVCLVRDVRRYPSFDQMLKHEDAAQAIPGLKPYEALKRLREIYPSDKERLGVVVLDLRLEPLDALQFDVLT
jgi:ASC-1-like (ASCH) protein/GNAT superfamily N-acetyltransferase